MTEPDVAVVVHREDPRSQDAQTLMDELSATLALFSGDGGQARFCVEDAYSARGAFVVARTASGHAIGCGAIRRFGYSVAELKRLYSRPNTTGVGRAILHALEAEAVTAGYRTLLAETRAINRRAIAFYERNGFVRIERFGMYANQADAQCFAKPLAGASDAGLTSRKHVGNDSARHDESD